VKKICQKISLRPQPRVQEQWIVARYIAQEDPSWSISGEGRYVECQRWCKHGTMVQSHDSMQAVSKKIWYMRVLVNQTSGGVFQWPRPLSWIRGRGEEMELCLVQRWAVETASWCIVVESDARGEEGATRFRRESSGIRRYK
jgi:hypothetical protein